MNLYDTHLTMYAQGMGSVSIIQLLFSFVDHPIWPTMPSQFLGAGLLHPPRSGWPSIDRHTAAYPALRDYARSREALKFHHFIRHSLWAPVKSGSVRESTVDFRPHDIGATYQGT